MSDTHRPTQDEIEILEDDAEALEQQAEDDGVLPHEDDIPENGVGPQTGVVP